MFERYSSLDCAFQQQKTIFAAIVTAAIMAKGFDFPMFQWGPIVSGELGDRERFPGLTLNSGNAGA